MPNSNQTSTQLSQQRPRPLNKVLAWIAGAGFVGFADSAYLTADHYFVLPLPCSIAHGCEAVLTSKYATVGPIPLALFGVAFYLAVTFLALYLLTSDRISRFWSGALFCLTAIGFLLSIAFESIQVFLIHAICQYCALSALCSLVLFSLGIALMRAQRTGGRAITEQA